MLNLKLRLRALAAVAVSLLAIAFPSRADDAAPQVPAHLKLFLLIGQSNMAGRGKIGPEDQVTNPHIWMLNKELQWVPAKDPLHFDKPIAGVGLGSEFARTLVKADPNVNIGLIPCAVGGTSLAQWDPKAGLYKAAVSRTKEALKQGDLAGILWHQGESDSGTFNAPGKEPYSARFVAMIAQLRSDLNAPEVPLVIGELGRYEPKFEPFNAMLPDLAKSVPHCALVSSEGLVDRGDHLHFNTPSLYILGRRYAEAYQSLAGH